jgi:uncharacterized protein YqeY
MFRDTLSDAYKTAMRERDQKAVSALRMIMAALKDRDIAARPKGVTQIPDEEILSMLQTMVKQRRESIALYAQGNRADLVEAEQAEIEVIERFLPQQMDDAATEAAVAAVIGDLGAATIKDMGRVMAELKTRFAGQMDFAKAGPIVKAKLG